MRDLGVPLAIYCVRMLDACLDVLYLGTHRDKLYTE